MQKDSPHSAELFTESRDYWWNASYLNLLAKEWNHSYAPVSAADLGCGVGHWTRIIARSFPTLKKIYAVDFEQEWVDKVSNLKLENIDLLAIRSDIASLPFEDASLDLITCQTVLMHVSDAADALKEIKRVLKPGGLFIAAEPNNLANYYAQDTTFNSLGIQEKTALFEFWNFCSEGRRKLGKGNDAVGEVIPHYLDELNFENIEVRLNDKVNMLLPPYDSQEQQAAIAETNSWRKDKKVLFNTAELSKLAVAGGYPENSLSKAILLLDKYATLYFEQIYNRTFYSSGGHLLYVIWARKPL